MDALDSGQRVFAILFRWPEKARKSALSRPLDGAHAGVFKAAGDSPAPERWRAALPGTP